MGPMNDAFWGTHLSMVVSGVGAKYIFYLNLDDLDYLWKRCCVTCKLKKQGVMVR
jgi:hypothetical protein